MFSTETILTLFYWVVFVGNFTGWMWEGSDGGPGWYDSLDDDGEAAHRSAATAKRQRSSQPVLPLCDGWTISTDHRQVIDHRQIRSDKCEDQPSHSRTVVRLSSKNAIACFSFDWLIDWLIVDWSIDWLIDCWLIDLLIDWLICWLIDWSIDLLIDWLIDWWSKILHLVVFYILIKDWIKSWTCFFS